MSHTIIKDVIIGGVQNLRHEIVKLQEILRSKHKRLHEMESLLTLIQGRPSSVSYEGDELNKSISTITSVDSGVQTEAPVIPIVKVDVSRLVEDNSSMSKLLEGDVLKIFYKGKVVGVGIYHVNPKQKREYYIYDTQTKKQWTVMSKWSLARKQEVNPQLKIDNAKKSVNCWRAGKWMKLEDVIKT
jgi:hypothetical protein